MALGKGPYKPEGYNSVSPFLIVKGAGQSIDFLIQAFGAVEVRRFSTLGGVVTRAEVRIDDTVVMIRDSVEGLPPVAAHVHVYVPDVDDAFRRALAAGAMSIEEPERNFDADKRGGVKDPGGTTWWLATKVE